MASAVAAATSSLFCCPPLIPNKIYTLNPTSNICFPLLNMLLTTPPSAKLIIPVQAVSSVHLNLQLPSSEYNGFSVTSQNEGNKLKISVDGARTQEIFDDVFSKMVAAAQPIPGFRRVKGGKTPDIPRDILLEVLGPSKVYKEVIKKAIDSAISEYVKRRD